MIAQFFWLVHKDLLSEWRSPRVWPTMLLFGVAVAVVFNVQMDVPAEHRLRIQGGLLWLAIFFAGMLAVDRSFAAEREEGCWQAMMLYPLPPAVVFLAKLAANAIALGALQIVLIPLFAAFSGVPLLARPGAMLLVAVLGNLGLAAAGTVVSALTAGVRRNAGLIVLLVLPLSFPVVLGAAEATRLIAEGQLDAAWLNWVKLLAVFAAVFTAVAALLFDEVIEE